MSTMVSHKLKPIAVPQRYNYIGVFLTLACTLKCSYCINRFGETGHEEHRLTGREWVEALNRLISREDLPVTLQGGEPSLHPDFYYILNHLRGDLPIDVLTNLEFDIEAFMREVPPERLRRNAPYASIRVSYHPEVMALEPLMEKVLALQGAGYSIGIWGILHPRHEQAVRDAREYCAVWDIDFRFKEFLGEHDGRMHGTYRYPGACDLEETRQVDCRTTEMIVGPSGQVYRCHSDLYEGRSPVGDLCDPGYALEDVFRPCSAFGRCNPCDVKVKTNRHQTFGHTSVEICFAEENREEP